MENILNYICLRKDISFFERAFNQVDALILSTLAYAEWGTVFQEEEVTLSLACLKYLSQKTIDTQPNEKSISSFVPTLIRTLHDAERFQNIKLKNFYEKRIKKNAYSLQHSHLNCLIKI